MINTGQKVPDAVKIEEMINYFSQLPTTNR